MRLCALKCCSALGRVLFGSFFRPALLVSWLSTSNQLPQVLTDLKTYGTNGGIMRGNGQSRLRMVPSPDPPLCTRSSWIGRATSLNAARTVLARPYLTNMAMLCREMLRTAMDLGFLRLSVRRWSNPGRMSPWIAMT
jgi:hypothetical protein